MTDTERQTMTDTISPPQDSHPKPEFVIQKSRTYRPYFGLLYGSPGVGKTTLASSIPGAIIIDLEHGADGMDCDRITIDDAQNPQATIAKIKRSIAFAVEQGYTTIILDSLTSLAALFVSWVRVRVDMSNNQISSFPLRLD